MYAIDSKYPDFTGKEIVSINGIPVKNIRSAMRKAMPSENKVKAGLWSLYLNRKALLHQIGLILQREFVLAFMMEVVCFLSRKQRNVPDGIK